jgi:hypothetical protein
MNPLFSPEERQWPPTPRWSSRWRWPVWPTDFRKFMFWNFGATSVIFAAITVYTIPRLHTFSLLRNVLVGPIFTVHMASISGVAAWTIWNQKSWARAWAIAASLFYVLMFLRQFIIPLQTAWDHHLTALFVGLLGLLSFIWRDKPANPSCSGALIGKVKLTSHLR